MRRYTISGVIALLVSSLLPAGENSAQQLAKARTEYEARMKQIEKKLSKKKGKKGKMAYLAAKGDAISDLLLALESRYRDAKYREKKNEETSKLKEEEQALNKELEAMHSEGAVIIRAPVSQGHAVLRWEPVAGKGIINYGEHFVGTEIEPKDLLRWLNIGRGGYFGFSQPKHAKVWWDTAKENNAIQVMFNPGSYIAHWFYFRSPNKQKARVKLKVSKGDKIEKVWFNFAECKARMGSLKAEFREGRNILIVLAHNKKDMPYELAVEVTAKKLQIGVGRSVKKK